MRKIVLLLALATAACGDCADGDGGGGGEPPGPIERPLPPPFDAASFDANNDPDGATPDSGSVNPTEDGGNPSDAGTDTGSGNLCDQLRAAIKPAADQRGVTVGQLCNDPPASVAQQCQQYKAQCE